MEKSESESHVVDIMEAAILRKWFDDFVLWSPEIKQSMLFHYILVQN